MQKNNLIPGTRILKTLIAIVLSLFVAKLLSLDSTTIATISLFSINTSFADTKRLAQERLIGVLIAGIYTFVVVTLISFVWEINLSSNVYYVLVVIFMLLLMQSMIWVGLKNSFIYAIMVYIGIVFGIGRFSPDIAAIREIVQSTIAILICLFVESSKIINKLGQQLEKIGN